jgi:hypothetical protein
MTRGLRQPRSACRDRAGHARGHWFEPSVAHHHPIHAQPARLSGSSSPLRVDYAASVIADGPLASRPMIRFRTVEAPPSEGCLVYRPDEYSFDFLPLPAGGRSIGIGDLQLGVDESGRVVSVWGLCPYPSWKAARLTDPPRMRAGLVADGIDRLRLGETMPVAAGHPWPVSHDSATGWICVGTPDPARYDRCVEFATGCVAALSGDSLVALWLQPEQEPESTDIQRPSGENGPGAETYRGSTPY